MHARVLQGKPIKLIAARDFIHDGLQYFEGQKFTIEPIHAAALTYARKAIFADKGELPSLGPDLGDARREVAEGRRPRKRKDQTYQRRDLTAEKPDGPE